jgi:hypothetical protein
MDVVGFAGEDYAEPTEHTDVFSNGGDRGELWRKLKIAPLGRRVPAIRVHAATKEPRPESTWERSPCRGEGRSVGIKEDIKVRKAKC